MLKLLERCLQVILADLGIIFLKINVNSWFISGLAPPK